MIAEVLNFLCRRDEDCGRLGKKRHKQAGSPSWVLVKKKGKGCGESTGSNTNSCDKGGYGAV